MSDFLFPSIFLSHGSPMVALRDDSYSQTLRRLGEELPPPRAVVVVSPHWQTPASVQITSSARPGIQHDFSGFPPELYEVTYDCPGHPEVAERALELLSASAPWPVVLNETHALDHGVWVPLRFIYPDASVPVIQVSLPLVSAPEQILPLGRALAQLRREGVLLVGSGGLVHNLRQLNWSSPTAPPTDWAVEFDEWVQDRLYESDLKSLLAYQTLAPHAMLAHPTPEHFYPLFFTLGAQINGGPLEVLYEGFEFGSLSMRCFALLT